MKNPFMGKSSVTHIQEDKLYERIYEEIADGKMDKAAQARAIEEGGGNDGSEKKAYIKHRFARLSADFKISSEIKVKEHFEAERLMNEEVQKEKKRQIKPQTPFPSFFLCS